MHISKLVRAIHTRREPCQSHVHILPSICPNHHYPSHIPQMHFLTFRSQTEHICRSNDPTSPRTTRISTTNPLNPQVHTHPLPIIHKTSKCQDKNSNSDRLTFKNSAFHICHLLYHTRSCPTHRRHRSTQKHMPHIKIRCFALILPMCLEHDVSTYSESFA